MAMGMWCDSLVMRVPIDEPQTTAPSPDSLKLRPLLSAQLQNVVEQAW
jgi:hypothetical protein